jgi:hypothetical protein
MVDSPLHLTQCVQRTTYNQKFSNREYLVILFTSDTQIPGMPFGEQNVSDLMHKLLVFQGTSSHASLKSCLVQPKGQQELLHWQCPGLHLHQVLQRQKHKSNSECLIRASNINMQAFAIQKMDVMYQTKY